ncbi:MAG: hypothetical protein U0271_25645 [Polyangiaceae bacterium]
MSDLFDVRVVGLSERTARLRVREVHPDAATTFDEGFALMVLVEGTNPGDPLTDAVSFDDTLDAGWMARYARAFVASVQSNGEELSVTVTDSAWIAHLSVGKRWASAAFSPDVEYQRCEPARPGDDAAGSLDADDAWIVAPREAFAGLEGAPPVLTLPAYSPGAYAVVDVVPAAALTPRVLQSLAASAVEVLTKYKARRGALVLGDWLHVAEAGIGHIGSGAVPPSELVSVGRLVPKRGARRGERLRPSQLLRSVPIVMESADVKGAHATLQLRLPPDGRLPDLRSATDALRLITRPFGDELRGDAPLARSMRRDQETLRIPYITAVPHTVARGYVTEFRLYPPDPTSQLALDSLDNAALTLLYTRPWPRARVEVTVTHPSWLTHLAGAAPYELSRMVGPEALPWSAPPRAP